MAKGRMINNKIVLDKKVHDLSSDTSRLAFTWAITFADCEGRIPGDPTILRSTIFPRRTDITDEQMQLYIQEWASKELIVWYEAEGDLWIQFTNFEKNQVGLRKDREAPSFIPVLPLRSNSSNTPEQLPVNRTEKKRTESDFAAASTFYQNNIAMLVPHSSEELQELFDEYGGEWLIDAMKIAVERNARNLRYVHGVLKNRKEKGWQESKQDVWAEEHY